jgi:hypothetical protein
VRLHFEEGERELLAARLGLDESADDTAVAQAVADWMQDNTGAAGTTDNNTGRSHR